MSANFQDFIIPAGGLILWLGFGHYFKWGGALLKDPYRLIFNYTWGTLGICAAFAVLVGWNTAKDVFTLAVVGGIAVIGFYLIDYFGGWIRRTLREQQGRGYDE